MVKLSATRIRSTFKKYKQWQKRNKQNGDIKNNWPAFLGLYLFTKYFK